jgi:precorrin-3B synthase
MQTGDGLLARLPQMPKPYSLEAFAGLCAAARELGNGIVEVTARGSIQIRGLRTGSLTRFAEALTACGIDGFSGPPLIGNPLAGSDPTETLDVTLLLAELRPILDEIASVTPLAPKVSIVVDGGGALHLDAIGADLRLRAETTPAGIRCYVLVDGDGATARVLGALERGASVGAVVALVKLIASRGDGVRARDIIGAEGIGVFRSAIADKLGCAAPLPGRPAAIPIGRHALKDGRVAVGIGLAFGQAEADGLERLVELAARAGATGFAVAQGRALLAVGLAQATVAEFVTAADTLGFVTRPDDPRRFVVSCAGAPACASAEMPARASGPAIAAAAAGLLDGSLHIHVSGCAKGCAHPGSAALTFVGAAGRCGLIVENSARTQPVAFFPADTLPARLARLADQVECARRAGETSAEVLARFGAGWVSSQVLEGTDA